MGQIVPIEGSATDNAYFIEYDEDQWHRYDDAGKEYCKSYWLKKAEPMGVRFVALRLVPDPLFPAGARETPYIEWQHVFEFKADIPYTTQTVVHVTLNVEPEPKVRFALEDELRKTHPKGTTFRAWWDGKQYWTGRV